MALSLGKPTPYAVLPDKSIKMLTPHHYVTLMQGIKIENPADTKGQHLYRTEKLHVCDGKIYLTEDKTVDPQDVGELYPWFWAAYRNLDPAMRREVRLALPEDAQREVADLPASLLEQFENLPPEMVEKLMEEYHKMMSATEESVLGKPKVWLCTTCGDEVPMKQKGLHIANHKKSYQVKPGGQLPTNE